MGTTSQVLKQVFNVAGVAAMLGVLLWSSQTGLRAQVQGKGGAKGAAKGAAAQTAKGNAAIDITGVWVSVVTEDWRYRMVMPAKGDFQGVPMTPEARALADLFDPAKPTGDVCQAYGAPSILRQPGRLRISWQDDNTLKMETDAGKQTRLFHFGDWKAPAGPATLQGNTAAEWQRGGGGRGGGGGNGWMTATTTNLKPGLLRKNGIPYSDAAQLTEYYELIRMPNGDPLLVATVITNDSKYLRQPFIVSTHFRKEANDAKWRPSDCSATW